MKRRADAAVLHGADIMSAKDFVKAVQGSNVDLLEISSEVVLQRHQILETYQLNPIPGTMKLHQVFSVPDQPATIQYRDISCTCVPPDICPGHDLKNAVLVDAGVFQAEPIDIVENQDSIQKTPTTSAASQNLTRASSHLTTEVDDLPEMFDHYLAQLQACENYGELQQICQILRGAIRPILINPEIITTCADGSEFDHDAQALFPDDVITSQSIHPCISLADGNCLPSCGSRFAFSTIERTTEIRVRIIVASVVNEDLYLSHEHLAQGLTAGYQPKNLPKNYAQYSMEFIPGTRLNPTLIRSLYREEIMHIRRDRTYMGIWQVHALSSVLNAPVRSVHPKKGQPNVRKDLNRLIMPCNAQTSISAFPAHIMWTSARADMVDEHWVANHFVPVLPLENGSKNMTQTSNQSLADQQVTDISELLNTHVLLHYRGQFYPGFVLDFDDNDVFVELMHRVGKKMKTASIGPRNSKTKTGIALSRST